MKNQKTLIQNLGIVLFLFFSLNLFSQSQDPYEKRLFYLCKSWGHVKYFHSEVAKGYINWDYQLINAISKIKNSDSDVTFNSALKTMLNAAGDMPQKFGPVPGIPDSLNNNTEQEWMNNSIFSAEIKQELKYIKDNFRAQESYYAQNINDLSNPNFDTDIKYYQGLDYPSEEIRLLALFKYWNIINYFYPYKKIMDQEWDETLTEFIPQVITASNALEYHLVMKEMTTSINDSHAFFYSEVFYNWVGWYFAPFNIRWIENETVITGIPDSIKSISPGDIIKSIDGVPINEIRDLYRKYAHGSNDEIIERSINTFILQGEEGAFELAVENDAGEKTVVLERINTSSLPEQNDNPIWKTQTTQKGCLVGIVDMGRLEKEMVEQMFLEFKDVETIIFDIRNYPNGTYAEIMRNIYSEPVHFVSFTKPDITFPGRFSWLEQSVYLSNESPYNGNIIMLFDVRTQSHAEFTCMSLEQFPGVIKIGSQTSGADGNVSKIYLPGNIIAYATFLGTYYPDHSPTQRIGIIPDIEKRATISGIRNGVDEVLEYALDYYDCNATLVDLDLQESLIQIYPNPVKNILYFELHNGIENDILFKICDINGRCLKRIKTNKQKGEIDFSGVDTGMYILRIRSGNVAESHLVAVNK